MEFLIAYLPIAITVVFGLVIIGLAIWYALSDSMWPVGIAVVVLIAAIFYLGWWFLLWGVLLIIFTLLVVNIKGLWKALWVVLLLASFIVGVLFLSDAPKTEGMFSTPTPTNTTSDSTCEAATIPESQIHGGKVEVDLNDGDPFDYSLTIVNPDIPTPDGKTLVVLAEPGHIFDVVYPVMYFTSYRLQGSLDQALCSVQNMNIGKAAIAYVFVGNAPTPKGWTTTDISGWWSELVSKQYSTDEPVITPGGDWETFQVAGDDKDRDLVSENFIYGQFWNPNYGGTVVHVQVEKGYTLTVVYDWQGTYWTVSGANPVLVQDRFIQASKEVLERDELSLNNMTLLYCGDPENKPATSLDVGSDSLNWTTSLKYWDCEVTK